jgi:predicted dehydrogenase
VPEPHELRRLPVKRRVFEAGSAVSPGGQQTGCRRGGAAAEMTRSVGIIGAGNVVENAHLPVLMTSLDTTVRWIFDVDARRATTLARAYGIAMCAREDLKTRLGEVDVVLLATPYGARVPYYDLLRQVPTIALFVEKPLARSVEQHRAICRPYGEHRIACGLNRRGADVVRAARNLLMHRMFGALRSVRAGFGRRGAILGGGQYHSDPALAGGGVLFEMGVHYLDTALHCMDAVDVEAESGAMIEDLGFDLHTECRLRVTLPGGASVPLDVAVSLLANQCEGVEFRCEHATLSLSLARGRLLLRSDDGDYETDLTPAIGGRVVTSFQLIHAIWQDFLQGLDSGRPGFAAAPSSLLTTRALEAMYALPRRP